ncbi:hypothetical protein [Hahella ganghwensis]|uniref:hypothetical protein n=1 Tax=Hahella ganghwensis TaxID=286420 RepID=UPI00038212DB|nr:hypothetical protein [Hahella ganghwensis]
MKRAPLKTCLDTPLVIIAVAFALFTSITLELRHSALDQGNGNLAASERHPEKVRQGNPLLPAIQMKDALQYEISISHQRLLELWGINE